MPVNIELGTRNDLESQTSVPQSEQATGLRAGLAPDNSTPGMVVRPTRDAQKIAKLRKLFGLGSLLVGGSVLTGMGAGIPIGMQLSKKRNAAVGFPNLLPPAPPPVPPLSESQQLCFPSNAQQDVAAMSALQQIIPQDGSHVDGLLYDGGSPQAADMSQFVGFADLALRPNFGKVGADVANALAAMATRWPDQIKHMITATGSDPDGFATYQVQLYRKVADGTYRTVDVAVSARELGPPILRSNPSKTSPQWWQIITTAVNKLALYDLNPGIALPGEFPLMEPGDRLDARATRRQALSALFGWDTLVLSLDEANDIRTMEVPLDVNTFDKYTVDNQRLMGTQSASVVDYDDLAAAPAPIAQLFVDLLNAKSDNFPAVAKLLADQFALVTFHKALDFVAPNVLEHASIAQPRQLADGSVVAALPRYSLDISTELQIQCPGRDPVVIPVGPTTPFAVLTADEHGVTLMRILSIYTLENPTPFYVSWAVLRALGAEVAVTPAICGANDGFQPNI